MDPFFKVVGHRGAPLYEPENTLSSFKKAYECGATAIEFDVRATRDGVLVLIHDEKVDRVTNGTGFVAKLSFREIRGLNVGVKEKVPTLDEVLEYAKDKLSVDIEIKVAGIEEKVLKSIQRHGVEEKCIITSFIPQVLAKIKKMAPSLKIGVLCSEWSKEYIYIAERLKAYAILPYFKELNKDNILFIRSKGFKIIPWTINNLKDVKRLVNLGVDGVITDDPCTIRKYLDSLGI